MSNNKSISTGEFQWLNNNGDEKKQQNAPPAPAKETIVNGSFHSPWYSKKDPAQIQYSQDNPYIRNGRELDYETQRKIAVGQEVPKWRQPQAAANFIIPNQPQFMIPRQRGIPNGLQRANSLPNRPQMNSMQLQRQSMPNLIQPPNPQASTNPQIALISPRPMSHPPAQIVNPQNQIPLNRQTPRPLIPRQNVSAPIHHSPISPQQQMQRASNQGQPKMVQNRFLPTQNFQIPHQIPQVRRSVIQPQPNVLIQRTPQMAPFVVRRHPGQPRVLHPRNGNVVTMSPQPQSLIQYNKPIMMNPPQHATQFKQPQYAMPPNHRMANGSPSNSRATGGGRQRRTPKSSKNKYHSVLQQVSISDDRNGKKSLQQTQNLLAYGNRIEYNTPLNHLASNKTPIDRSSRKSNASSAIKQRNAKPPPAESSPPSFADLIQTVDMSSITRYLTLNEFLNVFGVLSKRCHDLLPHIGWVETINIQFGESHMLTVNDNIYISFYDSEELSCILKVLSSKIIRNVKFEVEEDCIVDIPFPFLKSYFGACDKLHSVTIDTQYSEAKAPEWQKLLVDLHFKHLVIEKNPFPLELWFIKDLLINHLTILSPERDYRTSLELFTNLPSCVAHMNICRPSFSISKLLARRRFSKFTIRNPAKLDPLEPHELLSLFTHCTEVELDFSLVSQLPDLRSQKLSVKRVVFNSDGSASRSVLQAKSMFNEDVDVLIQWSLLF